MRTLSPSTAGHAILNDGCRFRLLASSWANKHDAESNPDGIPKMMPDAGRNVLGIISHDVLERAENKALDSFKGDWISASEVWDELVGEKEEALKKEEMNAHLIPLKNADGYLKEKGRVCLKAEKIRANAAESPSTSKKEVVRPHGGYGDPRITGAEVKVRDREVDPRVSGVVDSVRWEEGELIILDWKTGKSLGGGVMKDGYIIQLQLYAALLARKQADLGQAVNFPKRASLENPATNQVIELEPMFLNPSDCEAFLIQAIGIFEQINDAVEEDDASNTLMNLLASPDEVGCQWCPVRPICEPYLGELKSWMADTEVEADEIPFQDAIGDFIEMVESGPSSPHGAVHIRDSEGRVWRVAGVDFKAERNATLRDGTIKPGDSIAIFNVYPNERAKVPGIIHLRANRRTHVVYSNS
jgi:hypothetical protein